MRTARVTVVVLCVCMYVCMYVCPLISATSHIGITKEIYQQVHGNTAIILNLTDFPKNALFKSYGVNMPTLSSSGILGLFPHEISFYATFFTAQTMCLWKTTCDSLAQSRKTTQIYGSRILITILYITCARVGSHTVQVLLLP